LGELTKNFAALIAKVAIIIIGIELQIAPLEESTILLERIEEFSNSV